MNERQVCKFHDNVAMVPCVNESMCAGESCSSNSCQLHTLPGESCSLGRVCFELLCLLCLFELFRLTPLNNTCTVLFYFIHVFQANFCVINKHVFRHASRIEQTGVNVSRANSGTLKNGAGQVAGYGDPIEGCRCAESKT